MESGAPNISITSVSLGFSFKNSQISYSVNNPSDRELGTSVDCFMGGGMKGAGGGSTQAEISNRNNISLFNICKNTTVDYWLQPAISLIIFILTYKLSLT
jgi:hypothetical protein